MHATCPSRSWSAFGLGLPVRTLISVPAGIAEMRLAPFLLYSGTGTLAWTALLAAAGFFLETQYRSVIDWMTPVSNVIVGVLVLYYIYRFR